MQNNAPKHAARATIANFKDRGIHVNWMKDYIQQRYGNIRDPSYDPISEDRLQQLLEGLSRRCQKVYDAGSGHIEH
ncbi:hypothetical protein F4801DRAFT_551825 [Xylaria longipes]|nr:hypothetical protein F4801DRAFT_551825 [Xylaria longipes]